MLKQSKDVNLILKSSKESPRIRRLKIISPIITAISLIIFIIIFFASIIYVNDNISKYNFLKKEVENMETKISESKNKEGLYKLTSSRLKILSELANINQSFIPLMTEMDNLGRLGLGIKSVGSDNKGNVSVALTASSSSLLDNLVTALLINEQKKLYNNLEAHGIVRDKKGNYLLTITLKSSQTLLK